ncbi:MAG TPA: response regulator transcription factor [Gaiellaceae bacterium]|jgi:DNA-binding NarL/FixJ family response regulator|nr:response regulator transcription factor [Gaiellaceae bacterium]
MTGARVLLCDDCAPVRELVRLVLELEGIDVVGEAGDGGAAIEEAGRCQPDVVLLDLSMPAMDGLEALPEIRRVAPQAKVVVLSGFDNPVIVERALELGAVRYVEKGGRPEEIVAAVEEAAGG